MLIVNGAKSVTWQIIVVIIDVLFRFRSKVLMLL